MSCEALKSRVLPRKQLEPLKFGVAYARVVYKDYEILEDELRSSYHPQNYFCYSVDKTAGDEFTRLQYDVNRYGSYMNHAFYECLKLLITKQEWQYVLLMQNHDIMIKSVYETVTILDSLGGANDVHVKPCEEDRWNHSAKWDASSLKFYHNGKCSGP
ncbi:Core-2/I-Branching enzyme [Necator americanus]|uniref:Core-2/I-Branching enzyme n=1 Tax=Necator americanus TaxID=51031 RepID=W2T015_NECAM|nr:Core-2/I-Branching enzyme [Necator americanus]ETN74899.1 Core-2/I-Branching enzyme [Necator americanus]